MVFEAMGGNCFTLLCTGAFGAAASLPESKIQQDIQGSFDYRNCGLHGISYLGDDGNDRVAFQEHTSPKSGTWLRVR